MYILLYRPNGIKKKMRFRANTEQENRIKNRFISKFDLSSVFFVSEILLPCKCIMIHKNRKGLEKLAAFRALALNIKLFERTDSRSVGKAFNPSQCKEGVFGTQSY